MRIFIKLIKKFQFKREIEGSIILSDMEKFQIYKKFSKKYKNEGDYDHNYFLADLIPIFSPHHSFKPAEIEDKWRENTGENDFLSMYVHVPFCIEKCSYCVYNSDKLRDKNEIDNYFENLMEEIRFFGEKLDLSFNTLYFGGGTPTILSASNLDKLLSLINGFFEFEEGGMRNFEVNPATCTEEKLDVLEKHGINRISFGVQSTDAQVLEKSKRGYQTLEVVKKAYEKAEKRSFDVINIDLILGLPGSDKDIFMESFEDVIMLEPSTICVYPLQPTQSYLESLGMEEEEFFDIIEDRIDEIKKPVSELADKKGYSVPPTPNPREANSWMFQREDYEGFDYDYYLQNERIDGVMGFGVHQESYITDVISYSREGSSKLFDEQRDVYRGIVYDSKDKMRKYILIELARNGRIDLTDFKDKFETDIEEEFGKTLEKLEELDFLDINEKEVFLNTDSPLDSFAACFFFMDEKRVKQQITEECRKNNWLGLLQRVKKL